jgi:hypothetical protein
VFRRLKIIVPAIQVLAAVAVFGSGKLCHNERFLQYYIYPFQGLVELINLPLLIVWVPIGFALAHLPSPTGWLLIALATLFALLLVSSVALFWYLVVAEIELRIRGGSMLRFSGWIGELFTVAAFCLGAIALFYAYQYSKSVWYYRRVDGIEGGAAIAVWGAVFIAIAVSDLARKSRPRT